MTTAKDYKLYIVFFDAKLTFKQWRKYPFSSFIKFAIKLGTWSTINHTAHVYNYGKCGRLVNQAAITGYESIDHTECFKKRIANIYAYEVKVPIDFKKLHEYTKSLRGRKYDTKGAIYSDVYRIPFLRIIFKRNPDDINIFCSESIIKVLKDEGYLKDIENENTVTPKSLLKILKKHDLCKPPILIWKGDKLVNNIFG